MKRKILLLTVLLILALSFSVQASSQRTSVLGQMEGIVEDEVIDVELNPAQLYKITGNKVFLDNYLELYSTEDTTDRNISLSPTAIYHLNEQVVVGGKTAYENDFYKTSDWKRNRNFFQLHGMGATKINDQLIIGGTAGFNKKGDSTNSQYDDFELALSSGAIYQLSDSLVLDGKLGINTYDRASGVSATETKIHIFARAKKQLNADKNVVGVIDFKFDEGEERGDHPKRLAVGQNFNFKNNLLVYGGELVFAEQETELNLSGGIERKVTDKLTLRAGKQYTIFRKVSEENNNYTRLNTPTFSEVNLGTSYQLTDSAKIDVTYWPIVTFQGGDSGHNQFRFDSSLTINF